MITVDLFLLLILAIIFYYGYQYIRNILTRPMYPQYSIILYMLLIGIVINLVIYLILTLYHYYKDKVEMVGGPGKKGQRGDIGDIGDSKCPSPSNNCYNFLNPNKNLETQNNSFDNIIGQEVSLTSSSDGLSLGYNPIASEFEDNHKPARFAHNNNISHWSIIIKQDDKGFFNLSLKDQRKNQSYSFSISNELTRDLTPDQYFPPSDRMGIFKQSSPLPLIFTGTPDSFTIEAKLGAEKYALIKEKRSGYGPSIEDGQYAVIFRRNGRPTTLRIRTIPKKEINDGFIYSGLTGISNNQTLNKMKSVYRYFNPENNDYILTDNHQQVPSGYNYHGIAFQVYSKPTANTKSLYQCYHRKENKHYLSNHPECQDSFDGNGSIVSKLGYIPITISNGLKPLYRCYHQGLKSYNADLQTQNCLRKGYRKDTLLGFTNYPSNHTSKN